MSNGRGNIAESTRSSDARDWALFWHERGRIEKRANLSFFVNNVELG